MYSVDHLSSLNEAIYWGELVQRYDKTIPFLFIGNKTDLRKTVDFSTISFETAKNLIHVKFPEAAIIECSCATGENIIRAGWILANLAAKKWKVQYEMIDTPSRTAAPRYSCLVQ